MATKPNPKDSMKSTWLQGDRKEWTVNHWLIYYLDVQPTSPDKPVPVHSKTDKVPYVNDWSQHLFVIVYAFVPLAIHQAWLNLTAYESLGAIATFQLYFTAFNFAVIHEARILRRLGHLYGFLDGDTHERDGIPDVGVAKVAASLYKTTGSRIAMAAYLTYNPAQTPAVVLSDWTWWAWLGLQVGLYGIVLDFWFYWYHRAMHDVGALWKFHRTHHLTKHPNALLSAYADHEQEFFDMVGVPFMTFLTFRAMGIPLGFYEWYICHQYIAYTEVWGHSGLRVIVTPPSTLTWFLKAFRAEIVIEDHDLHHRKGWRKSHNYGKQTRLWDRIFGTCIERIESVEGNIDYVNKAHMPLF